MLNVNNGYESSIITYKTHTITNTTISDVFYEKCSEKLVDSAFMNCYSIREIDLPIIVHTIGDFCFASCINLCNINFPPLINKLGSFSFFNCLSLDSIFLPLTIKNIGEYAFLKCDNIKKINIPNNLIKIKRGTFQQCEKLDNIVIPASVEQIDEFAFLACSNLRTLISENIVPPKIKKYTFDIDNKITVFVPDVSVELYKSHEYWGKMKIKPMSELKK